MPAQKQGTPLKAPTDPGPGILAAIARGKTPRDRVSIMQDQIQRAYAFADSEGAESRSRWHGQFSRLKTAMLDACFNFTVVVDREGPVT